MTEISPGQAMRIVEAVREAARHGTEEPRQFVREWARDVLEIVGNVPYWPAEPLELGAEDPYARCRFPLCDCNMNQPMPGCCEEYRGS